MNYRRIIVGLLIVLVVVGAGIYYFETKVLGLSISDLWKSKENPPVYSSFASSTHASEIEDYFENNKFSEALRVTNDALGENPNDIGALIAQASIYAQMGSVEFKESENGNKAIETANRILAIEPNNATAYRLIGYANEILQKYPEAIAAYNTSLKFEPNSAEAYSGRGHAYDLSGDLAKAEEDYKKSLSINPEFDHALINMARIAGRKNDFAGVKSYANKTINVTTSIRFKADAEQLIGLAESALGNLNAAQEHFDKAIDYDPSLPAAWVAMADNEMLRIQASKISGEEFIDQMSQVSGWLQYALELNPNQTSAYVKLGEVLEIFGNKTEAGEFYKKALATVPNDITLGAQEKIIVEKDIKARQAALLASK